MSSTTRARKTRTTASTTGTAPTLQSVPDQTVAAKVRTDTEDKLWEALHANPNSTAADLSMAAKIGKSTAQKILAKWAADGSVTRTAGVAQGGRRTADLWEITEADTASVDAPPSDDVDTTDPTQAEPDAPAAVVVAPEAPDSDDDAISTEGDPAEPTDEKPTDTEPSDTAADDAQNSAGADTTATTPAAADPVVSNAKRSADDSVAADGDTPTEGDTHPTGEKTTRLAPGALRGMVENYLRDHPGEQFGPTAIANALGGKSSGAVSNALDKLVDDGVATKTQDKPRRFALARSEQEAAASTN